MSPGPLGWLVNFMGLPGNPVHIRHILDGRFSNMDRETLQYHFNRLRAEIPHREAETIRSILDTTRCETNEQREALGSLLKRIDPHRTYTAYSSLPRVVFLAVPLIMGVLSIAILLTAQVEERLSLFSRGQPAGLSLNEIRIALKVQESRLDSLTVHLERIHAVQDSVQRSLAAMAPTIEEAKHHPPSNESGLTRATRTDVTQLGGRVAALEPRLEIVESLVLEKPEAVVGLRLLQRDVEGLKLEVAKKAGLDVLLEKEARYLSRIDTDFSGLTRELDFLRWVLYMLVIGLTASGGLIVAFQRRRQ